MTDYLDELYEKLGKVNIFESMPECVDCDAKCNSPRRGRWLLKEEVKRLKGMLPVVEVDGALFFDRGRCPKLKDNGECGIYDIRPLECRLNPVAFTEMDGRLYWILDRGCKLLRTDNKEKIDYFKSKAGEYIDTIEPLFSQEIWDELRTINKAINTFDPYIEDKDCITLREVKM